jgi:hypothetical protein
MWMTLRYAFPERVLGWRSASALTLLLSVLPRSVAAQAPSSELPIELSWRAPPECPQREVVLSRARALLGAKAPTTSSVRAEGEIQTRGDGFELKLAVDEGRGGERKVWARQCDELGSAAAIALVLLLTSNTAQDQRPGTGTGTGSNGSTSQDSKPAQDGVPPSTPAKEQTTQPAPVDPSRPPSPERPRAWRVLAEAPQLAVGLGPLPKPTLGLGVGLGFQGEGWSLRVLGQWYSAQAVEAPVPGYGANVKRAAAGLWACSDLKRGAWSLSPCAQSMVVHLRATGYGPFLRPATQTETSFAVGVGAIGRVQALDWLAFMVGVGAQVELSRPIILLRTVGVVRQLAPVSGILQLGPEWIF